MDDTLKQRIRKHLKDNEGVKLQPYKDSKGNLTVGVGFNVSKKSDFTAFKFQTKDAKTGQLRDATPEEKGTEFDRLSKMSRAEIDADENKPILPDTEIDTGLDAKITEHETGVKKQIGEADWNKLTDGQKTAVLDVHYANPGGLVKFSGLKKAIKDGDAKEMAKQSDFHGGNIQGSPHKIRNFDRVRRNRAEIQGVNPESPEAFKDVADTYPDHPNLPPNYKKHQTPAVVKAPTGDAKQSPQVQQPVQGGQTPGQQNPSGTPAESPKPEAPQTSSQQPVPPPQPVQAPQAPEQKQSEAPADPKMASLMAMAREPITAPGRAALLKPVEKLTQPEMMDMIHSAQEDYRGWRSGDPLKAHTYEKVQDWHVNI